MVELIFYISGTVFFSVSVALMLKFYFYINKMAESSILDAIMSSPSVEAAQHSPLPAGTEGKMVVDEKTSVVMTDAITTSLAKVYTNFVKTAIPLNEPETLEKEICDDPFLKSTVKDNLPFLNKYSMFLAPLSVGLKTASHVDVKNLFNKRNEEEFETYSEGTPTEHEHNRAEDYDTTGRGGTGEQDGVGDSN